MTVNELIANITNWFSSGWELLSAGNIGSMTIGQAAFTIVSLILIALVFILSVIVRKIRHGLAHDIYLKSGNREIADLEHQIKLRQELGYDTDELVDRLASLKQTR